MQVDMGSKQKSINDGSDEECTGEVDEIAGERGRTVHQMSIQAIKDGNPLPLKWDKKRRLPIGPYAKALGTWIGVCTRQYLPFNLEKFKLMYTPEYEVLKNELLKTITVCFYIFLCCSGTSNFILEFD